VSKRKRVDPIPEEFASYEEAAKFWDTHDTTDYPDAFRSVKAVTKLRRRYFEIEVAEEVVKALQARARRKRLTVTRLANNILRQQLASSH
jgi:dihydroneopterin aldolase